MSRSDEGTEDVFYDSQAIRSFVGIDLSREAAPDATTLLKFRRLQEAHQLTERIFAAINVRLRGFASAWRLRRFLTGSRRFCGVAVFLCSGYLGRL